MKNTPYVNRNKLFYNIFQTVNIIFSFTNNNLPDKSINKIFFTKSWFLHLMMSRAVYIWNESSRPKGHQTIPQE